ncbi:GUN4-like family protein [Lyngbya aestuarii BL J]|uniref:GUN4-like family protein n=2 Tax=Lyngbya aestuarii TaxID=118322 RepID=U7QLD8_9CYAN|nr:GUN4-like family protein [Lyngbya aestuarii BL J]
MFTLELNQTCKMLINTDKKTQFNFWILIAFILGFSGLFLGISPKQFPAENARAVESEARKQIKNQLYKELEYWLKRKEWKLADLITGKILLNLVDSTEKGWFDIEAQQQIPCQDINKIDQLWLKYSENRFGFSVQKQVFLKHNNDLQGYNEPIKFNNWTDGHEQFARDVGWLKEGRWLKYSELVWNNIKNAPKGHLPIGVRVCTFGENPQLCWGIKTGLRFSLLSRQCIIN